MSAKVCNCSASTPDPICKMNHYTNAGSSRKEDAASQIPCARDEESDDYLAPLFNDNRRREFIQNLPQTPNGQAVGRMISDESLKADRRSPPKRFAPLSIRGQSLTEYAIGGFEIDLGEVADAAREVIPLPPSQLPVIFSDQELNFYHHFFRALRNKLGDSELERITKADESSDDDEEIITDMIEDLIADGYDRGDDEFQILLKKVLTSTFSSGIRTSRKGRKDQISVRANLWGFQYIESGMKCKESDLRMWLKMNYSFYKTSWFNTFKLTGVPGFAIESELKLKPRLFPSGGKLSCNNNRRLLDYMKDQQDRMDQNTGYTESTTGGSIRTHRRRSKQGNKSGWIRDRS